ncbi:hypothetical protein [uncultured Desulfuromusa sp.]|uniref:hypothetical protein n=1 Tax=uncultured Desulfuromusa sp. TaxID=219183 RepID=UPI002AA8266F|nr:hypothetical protein [uncultured Desulfuromusa sp.]
MSSSCLRDAGAIKKTEIAQPNIKKQEAPVVADKKEIVVTDKKVVGEIDTQRRVDFQRI